MTSPTDAAIPQTPQQSVTSILWLAAGPKSVTGEQAIDTVLSGKHPVAKEMLWIHLERASQAEVQQLADRFSLDAEAVEDLLAEHERPKFDSGPHGSVLISRGAIFDTESGEVHSFPISAIVTSNILVTIADGSLLCPKLTDRFRKPGFLPTGASMLYQLMDLIVDGYAQSTGDITDAVDQLTERIFGDHPLVREEQLLVFRLRRSLTQMRRVIVPSRDLTSSLALLARTTLNDHKGKNEDGQDGPVHALAGINRATSRGFSDVAEHVAHGSDAIDSLREVMGSLMETNLSLADVQLNTVMKKLASWAALIAVPTLITGFMGMNVPYPGFSQTAGFVGAAVVMVVLFIVLYLTFRRKNWL